MRTRILATIMFVSTLALLASVRDTLAAAHYSQPSPSVPAVLSDQPTDPKLFEQIAFYPEDNLGRALVDLRVMKDRVCLVVPQGDTYANERSGQVATSTRTTQFMLIIADRDFSMDAKQMGSTRMSPGILNLKELTVNLLTAQSFIVEGRVIYFDPDSGAVVQWDLKDDSKGPTADMKSRESWTQLFTVNAGDHSRSVGRRT